MSKPRHSINGEIELLRFVMAAIIVVHHSKVMVGTACSPFLHGSLAVEFFFLVTGYLMMQSMDRIRENACGEQVDTWKFLGKKICAVFPEVAAGYLLATAGYTLLAACGQADALRGLCFGLPNDLLLLRSTAILPWSGCNGVSWYISSMLLAMAVLYPLVLRHRLQPWLLAGTLLLTGYLIIATGTLRSPNDLAGLCYKGNLRALCEISLGAFSYKAAGALRGISWTRPGRVCIAVFKFGILAGMVAYMHIRNIPEHDGVYLAMAWLLVTLAFSKAGADSGWYNRAACRALGRFSLPLYLGHLYTAFLGRGFLPGSWHMGLKIGIYAAASILSALLIMKAASWIRLHGRKAACIFATPKNAP